MTFSAQIINPKRTYQNKYLGASTYKGAIIITFETKEELDNNSCSILEWITNTFKKSNRTFKENQIIITDIVYFAGYGYNVWWFALNNLAELLNSLIILKYIKESR